MLKRLAMACAILATSTVSLAGNFYAGPMALIQTVTASYSSYRSLAPRLSLGYDGALTEDFRLAAEIFATPTALKIDENTPTGVYNAKTTRDFGFSILPEYVISEVIRGYARLGVVSTKFSGPDKYGTGAQFGLGVSVKTSDCLNVRAEYDYIPYHSVTGLGSPTTDFFGIGLIYDLSDL